MPTKISQLTEQILAEYGDTIDHHILQHNELTLEVAKQHAYTLCQQLRDHKSFQFNQLIDVCGVDYADYGVMEWETENTTLTGYSRGVERADDKQVVYQWQKPRFAVVYHLLSTTLNHRIRIRVFCSEDDLMVDSVNDIWPAASWFEREAYDLYGILFKGHPDLRRILTDYGFIGHPFRKDFPLSGHVEMRYDANQARVVYEPVNIEPRVTVPKVIRGGV